MKKTKPLFLTHKTKIILWSVLSVLLFSFFIFILIARIMSPFKVSIYNYESYLSLNVISKIKKEYSYHTFGEINEFTKAINTNKAVAGIGSDHQIAQLIIDNKIQKFDLKKIFGEDKENKFGGDYKKYIYSYYEEILAKHLDNYDKKIIEIIQQKNPNNIKNRAHLIYQNEVDEKNKANPIAYDADGDGKADYFYEYLVPYFIQDKLIVYNTNTKYKPHLKDLDSIEADLNNKETWLDIIQTLIKKHNYKRVHWTNSYLDNAMIGEFYATEENKKNYLNNGIVENLTMNNYREIIDYFVEFVQEATGHSIKDANYNKLVTSGLDLVHDIIEPTTTKADIAIMYNGDALDSYYAEDNFASLKDVQINYKRPKNNYMLLDAWIISKTVSKHEVDKLTDFLRDNVLVGTTYTKEDFHKKYFYNVFNKISATNKYTEDILMNHLFNDNDFLKPKDVNELDKKFFKENHEIFQDSFDFCDATENFNAVNYTPALSNLNRFLEKFYFKDENLEDDQVAMDIFKIENSSKVYHQSYQPLDLKLRTAMNDYYFEKTKS